MSECFNIAVGGIPLPELVAMGQITQKEVDDIVQRTRDGGGEIIRYGVAQNFYMI